MELRVIGLNFLYAGLGVVLMFVSYRLIDILTPSVDFQAELKNGNVAVAIFNAALFLAIAIIIGGALNCPVAHPWAWGFSSRSAPPASPTLRDSATPIGTTRPFAS